MGSLGLFLHWLGKLMPNRIPYLVGYKIKANFPRVVCAQCTHSCQACNMLVVDATPGGTITPLLYSPPIPCQPHPLSSVHLLTLSWGSQHRRTWLVT